MNAVPVVPVNAPITPDTPASATPNKKMYLAVGVVIVLIVIGVVLYFTVFKPKQDSTATPPVTPPVTPTTPPVTPPETPPVTPPAAPTHVTTGLVYYVDAGLPASYPGSGNTWNDLSGSGLTTTLYGSPVFSAANGGALSFVPSKKQYASTARALPLLPNWTVETWHYYDNTNGNPKYPSTMVTDLFAGYAMNFMLGRWIMAYQPTTLSTLNVGYYLNPHTPNLYTTTPGSSLAVGWYHIVGTFDGASLKLWLNNVNANTTPSAEPCKAGDKGIALMSDWGGKLAVVRIYNKALSSTEIAQNYNAGKARFGL